MTVPALSFVGATVEVEGLPPFMKEVVVEYAVLLGARTTIVSVCEGPVPEAG